MYIYDLSYGIRSTNPFGYHLLYKNNFFQIPLKNISEWDDKIENFKILEFRVGTIDKLLLQNGFWIRPFLIQVCH